ncbi:MAG: MFS transporter [Candidatus Hodarchaeales archaeon]|jgi:MFS family permease
MTSENATGNMKLSMPELILLLLSTLTVMAGATIAPALPALKANFVGTLNVDLLVRLTLTITPLFIALGAPVMGVIVDKWGRKNLIFITTIIYVITGSAAFFLDSLEAILISRALLGVAVAGIMTTATTLIADYSQGEHRNKVMGYQASFLAFGGIFFLILGGFLANIGWQFPFLIYLTAFPLVPGIWLYLYEPDRSILSLTSVNKQHTSNSSQNFSYLALGVSYIATLLFQIFFYFILIELPFFLSNSLLLDPELIGIVLAFTTISAGTFSFLYKQIKRSFDYNLIYIASFLFSGVGFFIIYLSKDVFGIVLGLLITGIGLGLFIPNSTVWITSVTPESSRGRVLSGFTSVLFLGQFFSPFVSQLLLGYVPFAEMFAISSLILFSIGAGYLIINYSLNSKNHSAVIQN